MTEKIVIGIIIILIISIFNGFFIISLVFIIGMFTIYQLYLDYYFKSNEFLNIKESIKEFAKNCNELNHHIQELKCSYINIKSYDYGKSNIYDNSNYNFKRKEWKNDFNNNKTHSCSASVLKNANSHPIKYLCKYFDIKITEESLEKFENVLNNFAAAEQGKILLKNERDTILNNISNSIPSIIYSLSYDKLTRKLGFETIDLSDLYFPVYSFIYISPGGNSSAKCDIKLDITNLNKLVNYLNDLVKFRNSIIGQRALMTSNLREKIKNRDNYTCQKCSLSSKNIKNLLLEIDHILPLSKGGITAENNLQTLCWKCNRTKGSKIEN
jgi:hypothetical protein